MRYFSLKYPEKDLSGFRKPDRSEKATNVTKKNLKDFGNLSGLVSKQFSNFFNSYSKSFNKLYNRRGRLFESSLKRKPILNDNYFTNMIRYIHFNPVLHEFVNRPTDWKFSSIHTLLSEKKTLIDRDFVLDWFGGTENFRQFHQAIQEDEFDSITHLTLEFDKP
ncbi:MAG: hypothetical protein GVY20_17195 [Bacteroidetes bacterium]|nr:hypothetical protein [Bacteroidota bacterium]